MKNQAMRIITTSGLRRPPLLSPSAFRLSIEQVHTATFHRWRKEMIVETASVSAGRSRCSRLSPERRADLLADIRKGYMELRDTPGALGDSIAEGEFWDAAFTDQIIDE